MMNNMNIMNPMGMNNFSMNQMIMNNQQNFMNGMNMDANFQIFLQLQNKIRELEEIIKQKDFEIISLKQKLNIIINANLNNMNPKMMNIKNNPINNNNANKSRKEISITVKSENDKFIVKCIKEDKASILMEKCNLKGVLTFNYKPIDKDLTLEENGIYDGYTIYIKSWIYRICFVNNSGHKHIICVSDDCPLEITIIYYFINIKREDLILKSFDKIEELDFLYNAQKLKILDRTPIKKIFFDSINPTITVIKMQDLMGG